MINKTLLFSLLIVGIGFICRAIDGWDIDVMQPQIGQLVWLISPLILAIIFHFTYTKKVNWGFHLQLKKKWYWYVIATLLFPILLLVLVILGINIGSINSLKPIYNFTFLTALLLAIPAQFIKNLFEEFVWRGYLFSSLEQQGIRAWKNDLIVGLVWALWHIPYLDGFTRIYHDLSWTLYLPLFIIGVIATAFIYGEIRRRSQSVWTAVILHTMANAFTNVLFFEKYIELNSGKEWWSSPTIDNLGYIILIIFTAFLLAKISFKAHKE